jgi:two-component sensor histidine kinase
MLWLVRRLVVKRLENIAAHAAHLGEGRAWTPLAESGAAGSRGDEVGVLVATLNRMAARLAETFCALERQVREKDVLLQEIYHRVKNNLQVVASLLNMQGRQVADAGMKELLAESANRVKSMALVHEQLYRSGDLSNISLAEYLKQLIEYIAHAHQPLSARVPVRLEAAGLKLGIETAVPLGLMVNELVSNAYKHGYGPQAARGEIVLRMEALEDGRVRLEVMDDGRGLPEGFDPKAASSLGLQLVLTLAQQLGGELRHASSAGRTSFEVLFRPEAREVEQLVA